MKGRPMLSAAAATAALVVSLLPASGCALLSRGAAVDTRWYTPELTRRAPGAQSVRRPASSVSVA